MRHSCHGIGIELLIFQWRRYLLRGPGTIWLAFGPLRFWIVWADARQWSKG